MKADRSRLRRGAAAPLGVALLAGLVLGACGGSSSGKTSTSASAKTGSSPSTSTGASGAAGRRSALETCLKQHGVTLPSFAGRPGGFGASGRFGASGASGFHRFGASGATGFHRFGASGAAGFPGRGLAGNSKYAAAFKACGADFAGGFGGGGFARPSAGFSASSAADRAAVTKYVACVRSHGYDLPNPNFTGKGPVFSTTQVNRSNAKFIAANSACESLLKFSGSGSST